MGQQIEGQLGEPLALRLEERLRANRTQLEFIEDLIRQEQQKKYHERKHSLLIFLVAEWKIYSAILTELDNLSSLGGEHC